MLLAAVVSGRWTSGPGLGDASAAVEVDWQPVAVDGDWGLLRDEVGAVTSPVSTVGDHVIVFAGGDSLGLLDLRDGEVDPIPAPGLIGDLYLDFQLGYLNAWQQHPSGGKFAAMLDVDGYLRGQRAGATERFLRWRRIDAPALLQPGRFKVVAAGPQLVLDTNLRAWSWSNGRWAEFDAPLGLQQRQLAWRPGEAILFGSGKPAAYLDLIVANRVELDGQSAPFSFALSEREGLGQSVPSILAFGPSVGWFDWRTGRLEPINLPTELDELVPVDARDGYVSFRSEEAWATLRLRDMKTLRFDLQPAGLAAFTGGRDAAAWLEPGSQDHIVVEFFNGEARVVRAPGAVRAFALTAGFLVVETNDTTTELHQLDLGQLRAAR